MAQQMRREWVKTDGALHEEQQIDPVKAKQGHTGRRILTLLVVALVLAFLVWIPVEIWGQRQATDVAPQQPGQQLQSEQPAPAKPSPSLQNGTAVPTETPATPGSQPPAPATAQ
ncbi:MULTISPECIES: hypothetical protein [Rhizobium]|uniref:Cytoskeletal protein RodZ n=1 Tax=Rhizobium metallidurans TaxID=1265931 RepID=A0A7W6CQ45_9HYPH|nr:MULTISPECIES: hypothetical protein [Rhizobium]MBB3965113.1 cytoskeletal protein RodZ [Rhizobium metallidurans]